MKIQSIYGLPFVEVFFEHSGKTVCLKNVLIDTGSASTVISADIAVELGLGPDPDDKIRRIRGVGGTEYVYEKNVETIKMGEIAVSNFKIQVGAMNYGFDINAIIGMDFLSESKAIVDVGKMIITTA